MLMEVKNQFKVSFLSIKYNIIREMVNPLSFILNVLFMMLNNATFIIQWIILFTIKDNIAGYTLKEVLEMWAFSAGCYGVWSVFFYTSKNLPSYIIEGKLDNYLVQSKNILISVLTSSTSISAIGDLLYGIILFTIVNFNIFNILLFIILIILGGLIVTSFVVILSSLTFFIGNSSTISEQFTSILINTSTYPISIYKKAIQIILFTIIPVGIIIHLPVEIIKCFNIYSFLVILGFTILIVFIAFKLFYLGLKKYSSSNLMNARV